MINVISISHIFPLNELVPCLPGNITKQQTVELFLSQHLGIADAITLLDRERGQSHELSRHAINYFQLAATGAFRVKGDTQLSSLNYKTGEGNPWIRRSLRGNRDYRERSVSETYQSCQQWHQYKSSQSAIDYLNLQVLSFYICIRSIFFSTIVELRKKNVTQTLTHRLSCYSHFFRYFFLLILLLYIYCRQWHVAHKRVKVATLQNLHQTNISNKLFSH